MADRRRRPKPSQSDVALAARIAALEARVDQMAADQERALKELLEAIAAIPGARGSFPPPKL